MRASADSCNYKGAKNSMRKRRSRLSEDGGPFIKDAMQCTPQFNHPELSLWMTAMRSRGIQVQRKTLTWLTRWDQCNGAYLWQSLLLFLSSQSHTAHWREAGSVSYLASNLCQGITLALRHTMHGWDQQWRKLKAFEKIHMLQNILWRCLNLERCRTILDSAISGNPNLQPGHTHVQWWFPSLSRHDMMFLSRDQESIRLYPWAFCKRSEKTQKDQGKDQMWGRTREIQHSSSPTVAERKK